jgi:hypothetical protein
MRRIIASHPIEPDGFQDAYHALKEFSQNSYERNLREFISELPFFSEQKFCYVCDRPAHENDELIDSPSAGERTIIVQAHARCTRTTDCCNKRVPSGFMADHYNPNRGYEHRLNYYLIDDSGRRNHMCWVCVQNAMEERGHEFDDYFECRFCNVYKHRDDEDPDFSDHCAYCVDNCRYSCEYCGDVYWEDEDHECSSDDEYCGGLVHDYSWKPSPYFFPPKERAPDGERLYFGIELEVEAVKIERRDAAQLVKDELGERIYLKNDGSLRNGFEIVTHPHTLDEFRKHFAFSSFQKFRQIGLRSWDTTTCGLHVHVSRDAFGSVPYDNRTDNFSEHIRSRQNHEVRFIKLVYDNETQVCKLAGRKSQSYANFSDKNNVVNKVKHSSDVGGRHAAVNTYNSDTLEVRIFKGSLRPERVLSAIEFVHAGVEYTRDLKVNGKNGALTWLAFGSYVHANQEQYPNLFALMAKAMRDERLDNSYQEQD